MEQPEAERTEERFPGRGPLSGFVVVLLRAATPDNDAASFDDLAGGLESRALGDLLAELGTPPTQRQVTSVEPARLRRFEEGIEFTDDGPDHSLTRFWRVDLRDRPDLDPDRVAEQFARLDDVLTAYAEVAVTSPNDGPRDTVLVARAVAVAVAVAQPWLAPAPLGVDARHVCDLEGGRGELAGLVDVEQSWRLSHPDLVRYDLPTLCNDNLDPGEPGIHGNGVVGIVGGDGEGLPGVAPKIRSLRVASHASGSVRLLVTDAIVAAVIDMQAGDVLLLEVQRGNWPTETDYSDFQAIRRATDPAQRKVVVVVEAAGDGGTLFDLDAWTETLPGVGERRMARGDDLSDSRAIMVGACRSRVKYGGHVRMLSSNWGVRVDCHAWGELVQTCSTVGYNQNFRDTSAASAIVAGVAVLAQSVRTGAGGATYTSEQMRAILPAGGTPQAPETGTTDPHLIGTMPDLAVIGPVVTTV